MAHTVELDKFTLLQDLVAQFDDTDKYPEFKDVTFHNTWHCTNVGTMMILEESNSKRPQVSERLRELAQGTYQYVLDTYGKAPPNHDVLGWGDMTDIVLVVERNFGDTGWSGQVEPTFARFNTEKGQIRAMLFQLNLCKVTDLERDLNILHESAHILDWHLGVTQHCQPMNDARMDAMWHNQIQRIGELVNPILLRGGDSKEIHKVLRDNIHSLVADRVDEYMTDQREHFVAELFSQFQDIPFDVGKILIHNGFHDCVQLLRAGVRGHFLKKKQAQDIYIHFVDSLFDDSEWRKIGRAVGRRNRVLS